MKQEDILSIVRHLLSAIGGYLVIKGIDNGLITQGSGVLLGLVSVIWSIVDKSATIDGVQGALRQVATFVGGIFIAKGKLDPTQLDSYLGLLTAVIPFILSRLGVKTTTTTTPTGY